MKRIALLLLVAACKTTDSAPQPQPAADPVPTARTQPRPPPSLAVPAPMGPDTPALPDDGGRHHGDRMAKMDTDGDGKVSDEEREAAMKERSVKMRARLDTNGDGKLTPDELASARGRMKFDDPAALDTNKDGDISAEELEAGMKAKREEMRAQRFQGAHAPIAPSTPATGQ
jgi:EF hand